VRKAASVVGWTILALLAIAMWSTVAALLISGARF
jgi:hypothetical protein